MPTANGSNIKKNQESLKKRLSKKKPPQKNVNKKSAAPKNNPPKKTVTKKTVENKTPKRQKQQTKKPPQGKLKIISLGGLNEIGKNMTLIESEKSILVIDCGLSFPDGDMPGIDIVIPDITYLEKNAEKVKAIVLTHGHEDHIGALPYVLKKLDVPVYGTKLTLGIVKTKLSEHSMEKSARLHEVKKGDVIKLDDFKVEYIGVNHSIADASALAIHTPIGNIIHTGDFKIDSTPIQGEMIDLARFGELGKEGVLLLMSDSTNAARPGFAMSEKKVGKSLYRMFNEYKDRRIIVATFASNVHRVQQIINAAATYGRKVAISGRSMVNIISISMELGYLDVPKDVLIDIDSVKKYPPEKVVVITTGSQGEPMSALYRMAFSDHKKIEITPNDLIIISASPIPGNEKLVTRVVNELLKSGAEVISDDIADVHVSGHACEEEIKLLLALTKPKFYVPVHGEFKHLNAAKKIGETVGIPSSHILISDIGKIIELSYNEMKFNGSVQAGKVLVDGLGVGDVGNIVLRDRKHLAQDGLIVVVATLDSSQCHLVAGPDIVSRGFVYVREAEDLMENVKNIAKEAFLYCEYNNIREWTAIKTKVKDDLSNYLYQQTKRKPMILPVIMEM
ncbi:MAG: ribonuclease J [Clostridia bacterium]|nr:ribonuclease J [Clostridia bacterium]